MLDSISLSRLGAVHPELARRVMALDKMLSQPDSVYFRVSQGFRSYNEQNAYWLQGRSETAIVNAARAAVGLAPITDDENKEVVTHAAPGSSMHNFGLAVDVVPDDPSMPGFQPDWDTQHPYWDALLKAAVSCGLAEGAQWTMKKRDYPHLYPQELKADPTDEMKQAFKDGGIGSVWNEVNQVLNGS